MRFYIATLGCPKNVVDSEMIAELLRQDGHLAASKPEKADVVIVNTCGFIQAARDESYGVLRKLAAQKQRHQWLIAAGCMAERHAVEIREHVPQIDALIGTRSWSDMPKLLAELGRSAMPQDSEVFFGTERRLVASVRRHAEMGASAYLKIADGCDASCAFCTIPLIKGPQQSKLPGEILREAQELADQDVREIILIAQDTTAYGRDLGQTDALPALLRAIAEGAPNVDWLRILYTYPPHITPRLIETMAELPQVCHYLDMPLQHAHPDTLRRMHRPSDIDAVHGLIECLRRAMPDISLRTTFIVGYPGETEREHDALLRFMQDVAFDKVGVFAFSPEEGTHAASLPHRVPAQVIAARREQAMLLQQDISRQRNEELVGHEMTVLIDGTGEGISVGRSYRDAPEIDGMVLLPGQYPPGEFITCRIVAAQEYDLVAAPA